MNDFEYVKCNICGSDETATLLQGRGPYQIVRCLKDDLVFLNPRPKSTDIRTFHTKFVRSNNLEYFGDYRRAVLEREAELVRTMVPGGRLLDVGCATGTFFESFSTDKWDLYGVDTSAFAVELARRQLGVHAFCGTIKEAAFPAGYFDAVTVLDALYYSPDPRAELAEYRRVLRDDGLLAIEIPGYTYTWIRDKGLVCRLMDGTWIKGFTESHRLYYFSHRSLRVLLTAAGFRLRQIIPEQASLGRRGFMGMVNEIHFACAKRLFSITGGRVSLAGKELYLATKDKTLD
jgi:SAM-dependent methyltransferase